MPDERELIKTRLGKLGLGVRREEEILRELSEHVADHAAYLEARGCVREEAICEALDSVSDWAALRSEILWAEAEEENMNYRTKVLWLPALGALALSSGLLALLQFLGLVPRFYWLSGRAMSGYPFFTFYISWLVILPVVGAVAAFWSWRAGGGVLQRWLAALAPSLGMLGFFLTAPLISLLIFLFMSFAKPGHGNIIWFSSRVFLAAYLTHLVSWVLLPALPLLLGAVPFLRRRHEQV